MLLRLVLLNNKTLPSGKGFVLFERSGCGALITNQVHRSSSDLNRPSIP